MPMDEGRNPAHRPTDRLQPTTDQPAFAVSDIDASPPPGNRGSQTCTQVQRPRSGPSCPRKGPYRTLTDNCSGAGNAAGGTSVIHNSSSATNSPSLDVKIRTATSPVATVDTARRERAAGFLANNPCRHLIATASGPGWR